MLEEGPGRTEIVEIFLEIKFVKLLEKSRQLVTSLAGLCIGI